MKHYKSIDDILVWNFYKIIDSEDVRFLIKKYNPEKDKDKVSTKLLFKLQNIFNKIVLDFNALNADNKTIRKLKRKFDIDYMQSRYENTQKVIDMYLETGHIEVLFLLKELKWSFDSFKDIDKQLTVLTKRMKTLKMKIKLAKIKYEKENSIKNKKLKKTTHLEELEKRAIYIEQILEKKYPINTRKTTLIRWCNLLEVSNNKVKQNG